MYLHEHFGSREPEDVLAARLQEAGFDVVPDTGGDHPWFAAEGVGIRPIPVDLSLLAQEWGGDREGAFVVELDRKPGDFSADHPLRRFFGQLTDPTGYGCHDVGSQHAVGDYLP